MDDQREKELLTDVLKALFGPQLKGKYIVTIRSSITVDASDKADAREKAKDYFKNNMDKIDFEAIKIDDLLEKERE